MATQHELVVIDKTIDGGQVWVIKMNRPKSRNAVNGPAAVALASAFIDFEHNLDAKVAVFTGEGGNFCAGADLQSVASGSDINQLVVVPEIEAEPSGAILDTTGPMGVSRMKLSKPVIAAVSGYAVAGGLELSCWCDLRVADETAVFGVFCRRFGVPLIDGGTVRLPQLIGHSRAMDMILTGRDVSAQEALSFGLVNRLIDSKAYSSTTSSHAPVVQAAIELAKEIAHFPQLCMRSDRMSTINNHGLTQREALKNEFKFGVAAVEAEGVQGAKRFKSGIGRHGTRTDLPKAKL